jgi:hypothetical protein
VEPVARRREEQGSVPNYRLERHTSTHEQGASIEDGNGVWGPVTSANSV